MVAPGIPSSGLSAFKNMLMKMKGGNLGTKLEAQLFVPVPRSWNKMTHHGGNKLYGVLAARKSVI
jgi:hypothetical protein